MLYIRRNVQESPAFLKRQQQGRRPFLTVLRENIPLFIWAVLLMTAFNFFSHGTQDIYPTFLETPAQLFELYGRRDRHRLQYRRDRRRAVLRALSQRIGRKRAIVIAALIAVPVAPLWAYAPGPVLLAIGAFLMQFFVQGAWGIVPVHLNELSPDEVRGTFPGFAYQLGNLLASGNATMQADLAAHWNGDYAYALVIVAAMVAVVVRSASGLRLREEGCALRHGGGRGAAWRDANHSAARGLKAGGESCRPFLVVTTLHWHAVCCVMPSSGTNFWCRPVSPF